MLKCELGAWVGRKNKRNDLDNEIHVYDSVFRTMIHNLKPYVPALVNEAFEEHYTDKALVTLKAGKEVQSIMGGYIIKTDIDEAMEKTEEQVSVSYIENVMNSLKCTARQAMEILRISPEKQKRYKRLLKKAANGAV